MRGRRTAEGNPISLFAFQDIITTVTGVLILILLLNALELSDSAKQVSNPSGESGALRQELAELLDRLATLRGEIQSSTAAKSETPQAFADVDNRRLLAELDALRKKRAAREAFLGEVKLSSSGDFVAKHLREMSADSAEMKRQNTQEQAAVAALSDAAKASEQRVLALESKLLAEQNDHTLSLVPESPDTSREPVLAVVSGETIQISRIGRESEASVDTGKLPGSLRQALTRYSPASNYVVFYFKPSGIAHFTDVTETARDIGFDIGYDAVGEPVELHLKGPENRQ